MCRMFSFYAVKTGEFYSLLDKTDEHSIIAAVFNLRDDDTAYYAENLAKGEFTPPADQKLWSDLSKWTMTVDERETPSWFDHEKAREYMERLIRPMFVTNTHQWLAGGCWIFDGEKASAKGVLGGRIAGVINGANLDGANLARANLDGANLARANLYGANLTRATLYGATLTCANLYGATLTCATLTRATLYGATLTCANLGGATLDGANLDGATLTCANLYGANLTCATLTCATLTRANLTRANLTRATLYGANLGGANLDGARIHEGADLPDGWIRNASGIIARKP